MTNSSAQEQFFKQNLTDYKNPNIVKQDVQRAIRTYMSLRPMMEEYTSRDGISENLVCLDGTIPVVFRQSQYNIPINIYILKTYPYAAPIVYVRPTNTMRIKTNSHVDDNGQIHITYLNSWKHPENDLLGLISVLKDLFGEQPPVFSKSPSTTISQPNLTVGGVVMPPPLPMGGMPPLPGYWSNTPYSSQPYPNPSPYPNYMPGSGWGSSTQQNAYSVPSPYPMPQQQQQNRTGTIDAEFLELSERTALGDKLRRMHTELHSKYQSEMQSLLITQADLKKGTETVNRMLKQMQDETDMVTKATVEVESKNQELQKILTKLETDQTEPVNVDEMVVPTAPLYRQLIKAYAEEQAIEDALYYLGEAVGKDVIDVDTFLRKVRELSRKQFLLRETVRRCRIKANLPTM